MSPLRLHGRDRSGPGDHAPGSSQAHIPNHAPDHARGHPQGHSPGRWLAALALAAALAPGAVSALGGVSTTTGRQVAARPDAPSVTTPRDARGQYVLHCAGCHGFDGRGAPAAYVPDLTRMGQWLPVAGGRAYLVKVPGVMASGLDDAQVAAVTNWLLATLARGSVPEGHRPYDAAEVSAARRSPLTDVAAERQRLIGVALSTGVPITP